MVKKDIIVLGGGDHAKVVINSILKMNNYNILGFLDDNEDLPNILGIKRVGNLKSVPNNLKTKFVVLGLGNLGNSEFRNEIIQKYITSGFKFESIIDKTAIISFDVNIGSGSFIGAGTVIQPGVTIENYSIINTNSSIDHDCNISENVHIAPGVTLCGNVKIGENSLIGAGSVVIQEIKIGKNIIIGAGSVVVNDCIISKKTYIGNPAKLI